MPYIYYEKGKMGRIIINGNQCYEIDEECMRQRRCAGREKKRNERREENRGTSPGEPRQRPEKG